MDTEPIEKTIHRAASLHDVVQETLAERYGPDYVSRNQGVVNAVAIMVQIQEAAKLVVAHPRD